MQDLLVLSQRELVLECWSVSSYNCNNNHCELQLEYAEMFVRAFCDKFCMMG